MTKRAGDTSDKITELRKEVETLRSECDALRREVRILRSINGSPTTGRDSTQIASSPSAGRNRTHNAFSPRARRVQGAGEPSGQEILTRQDREGTATFGDRQYTYRDGKLLELTERQTKTLSMPNFMADTAAWSEKRRGQGHPTFNFLRRADNARPETPASLVDSSWTESRPPTPSESGREDESSVFNNLPGDGVVDVGEVVSDTTVEDDDGATDDAPGLLAKMDLGEDLETTLRCLKIHSRPSKEVLGRALFLMQSILWERAREHWPSLFKFVDQGEYLIKMCRDEMGDNLGCMNIPDVCPDPRDVRRLWKLLREDLPRVRNRESHKNKEYLCNTKLVEVDLKDLQEAIYLLGDPEGAAEVRQLRDRIKAEAEKAWNNLTELHNRIELPGYEIQEQDMQHMHALDEAFAEIIKSERGLSSMPITVRETMVQVAEFYIQQPNIEKYCKDLINSEAYSWKQYHSPANF